MAKTLGDGFGAPISGMDNYKQYFKEEHRKVIHLANKSFGTNSWSHSVTKHNIDSEECSNGKYFVGASAVVRVALKQDIYHEELGCGFSFGLESKAISIANAYQEATLDALRKAILSFDPDIGNEESVPVDGVSLINEVDYTSKCMDPFHSPTAKPSIITHSPRNNIPSTNPNASHSMFNQDEQGLRAERKRKQQQLQEEYKQRMKQKEKKPCPQTKENINDQLAMSAIDDESTFISTQELDEMLLSAAAPTKHNGPSYRVPLISSPAQSSGHGWTSNGSTVKSPMNTSSVRIFMN